MHITVLDSMYNIIVLLLAMCKSVWYENDKNLIKIEGKIKSTMATSYAHLL